MRASTLGVILAAIALPGAMLAPVWQLGGFGAAEDDILYYFPARTLFRACWTNGEWPWLSPWTGLDRPLLADPQSAVFYPPTWLFLALPPTLAYPASLWLHYSIAFLGAYCLCRRESLPREAALFGAIAFAFCGFMLAHRAHLTIQHAAAWAPWVFWCVRRLIQAPLSPRIALAAIVFACPCFAGHVQIAALLAAGTMLYVLAAGGRLRWAAIRGVGLAWLLAAGLFSIQWVPTFAFVRTCTRTDRTFADFVENSLYPQSLVGATHPMLLGQRTPNFFPNSWWSASHQVEQFCYSGMCALLLAALALRSGWRTDALRRPWGVLLIVFFLCALGQFGPVCPLLYWLPGASLFRVPARALLLVQLALAMLAAHAFGDLQARLTPHRARLRAKLRAWFARLWLPIGIAVAAPLAILLSLPLLGNATRSAAVGALNPLNPALWLPAILAFLSWAALRYCGEHWQNSTGPRLLIALLCVDLGIIGWSIDSPRESDPRAQAYASDTRTRLIERISTGRGGRLWVVTGRAASGSPGEYVDSAAKLVANTNILAGIRTLTDYGPLTPLNFAGAFFFKPWGEATNAEQQLLQSGWMDWYDIEWLLLCEPHWPAPRAATVVETTREGYRLYHYPLARGNAFFEDAAQPGAVRYVDESLSSFTTHVDTWSGDMPGPARARVVVARLAQSGWTASANGREIEIERVSDTLLGVTIPCGMPMTIRWRYFPPGLMLGAALTGVALIGMMLLALIGRRPGKKRRRRRSAALRRAGRPV